MKRFYRPKKALTKHRAYTGGFCGGKGETHFRLLTNKSRRIEEQGVCSACGLEKMPLWYYEETSDGPRCLCRDCKEIKSVEKWVDDKKLPRRESKELVGKILEKKRIIFTGAVDSNRNRH